jgi:acetyltransferase
MSFQKNISALFSPRTVAVIGASASPGKIGNAVVSNLLGAKYSGTVLPVNPSGGTILGLPVTKSIDALPEGIDLAVITLPVAAVVPAMEALAARKVRAVIVITAGFKEMGGEGAELERRLAEIATQNGIAMVGPNCLGLISTKARVNASFAAGYPQEGKIAFFSQSGALCTAILDWALGENLGFSRFVSLGNKAALNEADILEYLRTDAATSVILGYIENVEDGERFLANAARVTREKPVILIKSGTTAAGAKATSSHTGAIAGNDAAYAAAFRKTGVIRAADMVSLFDLAQAFSTQPLPQGPGLAIVTNSGGPGAMAADAAENSALELSRLSDATVARLKSFLPPYASLANPIDIVGDAPAERYRKTLETVITDPAVHAMVVMLSPTSSAEIAETAQAIIDVAKTTDKPILASFMGGTRIKAGERLLRGAGIPCSTYPEPLIACIETMHLYQQWRTAPPLAIPDLPRDKNAAAAVIAAARARGAKEIVEFQAQEILSAYGLPVPRAVLAQSARDAAKAARSIGGPVAVKIASPQISHKSDVGGVQVNLTGETAAAAFTEITARAKKLRPEAEIAGCLVQEMVPKGCKELIVGFKRDDRFGPLLMFGLGGIYVEVLKDIAFRLAPLSREEAAEMIRSIKSYPLLAGTRGEAPANLAAIENLLLAMSALATDFPDIAEAEFNPVLVNSDRAWVADVRLVLA